MTSTKCEPAPSRQGHIVTVFPSGRPGVPTRHDRCVDRGRSICEPSSNADNLFKPSAARWVTIFIVSNAAHSNKVITLMRKAV